MTTSLRKKIFLVIFCLASITQGMYSTYFVSILTTIERVYQIQSKTAGAILSATEIGQIVGSLLIAYFGGRGNKPKWIAACMTLSAVAALISISPYFLLLATSRGQTNPHSEISVGFTHSPSISSASSSPSLPNDLKSNSTLPLGLLSPARQSSRFEIPRLSELCASDSLVDPAVSNLTQRDDVTEVVASTIRLDHGKQSSPFGFVLVIFFACLLAIGFGSTAITTLGIPFIDDIVSKEESPLYLGLTIGLRIFGPALGFLLGSFCINFDLNIINLNDLITNNSTTSSTMGPQGVGAWWLGLIVISIPLLVLALPMYFLSRLIDTQDNQSDDYADITYRAAEDHDIGGSHDFQSHMLGLGGLGGDLGDVTSDRTCFSSEIDSSSREVLQSHISPIHHQYNNYGRNLTLEQPPILTGDDDLRKAKQNNGLSLADEAGEQQQPSSCTQLTSNSGSGGDVSDTNNWSSNICVVVNHFGGLEASNFTNVKASRQYNDDQSQLQRLRSARSSIASSIPTSNSASSDSKIAPKHPKIQLQPQQPSPPQSLSSVADLAKTLSRLIKNKLLLLRMLSGILHILPIAGFYTFLPKYLIEQFRVTQSSASAVSGLAGILFVGLGAFLGGTIVRLLNVNSRLMTRWIATSALFYAIGMIVLMNLGCPQSQLIHYESQEFTSTDCKSLCRCSKEIYTPVCANQTTFISPCLAGCRGYTISGDKVIFDECGCSLVRNVNISSGNNLTSASTSNITAQAATSAIDGLVSKHSMDNDHVNLNVATAGHCLIDCDNLKWYIVIFSISTLIHASCEVGSMMFNLRCVSSNDRTLALGLITFSSSLLGSIPCSVIYGTIVDLTCVHWDYIGPLAVASSGAESVAMSRGACRAYENGDFRYYLHGVTALVMFLAFIVDCIICRRASEVDFYEDENLCSRTDIRMELKKSTETI